MSFLREITKFLDTRTNASSNEVDVLRNIISQVESLPPEKARYIACFAFLLGRVAYADLNTSPEEIEKMEKLVEKRFNLSPAHAVLVCKMAKNQNELFGSTENYIVSREFMDLTQKSERLDLIDFLFSIAAADDSISSTEEAEISQMANELLIEQSDLLMIRAKYRDKREVFKN